MKISKKIILALIVIILNTAIVPIYAQEPCDKCKENPDSCQLLSGGKKIEKKIIVMPESRGFLGVVTQEEDGKLVVRSVVPNSPAQMIGIMENDIIAEINNKPMRTPADLTAFMKTTKPNDIIHLKVISHGVEKIMDVELGEVPAQQPMKMKMKIQGRKAGAGAGYFGPGLTFFNYDGLNTFLVHHNIETIKKSHFVLGGGGWGQAGRIRIGGFGIGGSQTASSESIHVEVAYGAGFFEMGYAIINEPMIKLTPLIGIGGGGLELKVKSKCYNPLTLNDVFSNIGGVAKISKGGLTMFPGLSIDFLLGFAGLSFKTGYLWTPAQSSWRLENFHEIQGPPLDLKGPFAMATIMFGGKGK